MKNIKWIKDVSIMLILLGVIGILSNVYQTSRDIKNSVGELKEILVNDGVEFLKEEYGDDAKELSNEVADSLRSRVKRFVK